MEAAASMAISTFNEGATAMLGVMDKLWLQSTVISVNAMRADDVLRIARASAVHTASAKRKRKSVSTAKKVRRHQQELEEGPTYGAGMDM